MSKFRLTSTGFTNLVYSKVGLLEKRLLKINCKKKILFGKTHKTKSKEEWNNVIWSDESMFTLRNNFKEHVWEHIANPDKSAYCKGTVKGGQRVMVWDCFNYHGKSKLIRCEGKINSKKYIISDT